MAYLGIDLGTSGLRALIIDDAGAPLASATAHYGTSHPHMGWSEQDPQAWITALDQVMQELRATCTAFTQIQGIGVSGHMHGAVLLDVEDKVLRPCILWNDTRSHEEAAVLDATEQVRALSGNIVFPGFTAPKLLWVQKHEPEVFERIAKVLLPAAYLNLYLTGEPVADMSDSAGTSWLDVGARNWSEPLLSAGHMRPDQMPRLVEGSEPAGQLRQKLADHWGLTINVTIAGGAGDNAAAACGIGALREGQGFVSLGTSGVLLVARDSYAPAPETAVHTFCHAVPDRWYQMGVMLSATDSLNWLSRITGVRPAALAEELGDRPEQIGTVRFLPYLAGERTPHNDAHSRGAFLGLGTMTNRADMTRAVLEGVGFGLRDSLEALRQTGADPRRLFLIGGGSASSYWAHLLAAILGLPLDLPDGSEFGAALGAARLARIAAAKEAVEDVLTSPKVARTIDPDPTLAKQAEEAYKNFRASYPTIKDL